MNDEFAATLSSPSGELLVTRASLSGGLLVTRASREVTRSAAIEVRVAHDVDIDIDIDIDIDETSVMATNPYVGPLLNALAIPRPTCAATTVKSAPRGGARGTTFDRFAKNLAAAAMGTLLGVALGLLAAPTPARAAGLGALTHTPGPSMTLATGTARAKATRAAAPRRATAAQSPRRVLRK